MKKQKLAGKILAFCMCFGMFSITALTAENTEGQTASEDVEINEKNFPDANFRRYMKTLPNGEDGKLTAEEIKEITIIYCCGEEIKDLKGIEYFTELTDLMCDENQLTNLDVSKNTALTNLCCSYNELTSLDLSENAALETLWCDKNQLESLDLSRNTALTELDCSKNELTSLDLSKNAALTSLCADFDSKNMECAIPATDVKYNFTDSRCSCVDMAGLTGGKVDDDGKIVFYKGSNVVTFAYGRHTHKLKKADTVSNKTLESIEITKEPDKTEYTTEENDTAEEEEETMDVESVVEEMEEPEKSYKDGIVLVVLLAVAAGMAVVYNGKKKKH